MTHSWAKAVGGALAGYGGGLLTESLYPPQNGNWPFLALVTLGAALATYGNWWPLLRPLLFSPAKPVRFASFLGVALVLAAWMWALYPWDTQMLLGRQELVEWGVRGKSAYVVYDTKTLYEKGFATKNALCLVAVVEDPAVEPLLDQRADVGRLTAIQPDRTRLVVQLDRNRPKLDPGPKRVKLYVFLVGKDSILDGASHVQQIIYAGGDLIANPAATSAVVR